eukprot:GFUD01037535.1.p1 GENE.GFUD01037535.1~~GFUD01037535.1.p1  ORF type:complete len:286 (+),score=73.36 GFUD01037535.1:29-859(+)
MVEEFLPEEARIPRSEKYGTAEKKILETEEEVPGESWIWPEIPEEFDINGEHRIMNCCHAETLKVIKIDGFEIECIKDTDEDINGNLTEDRMSKNSNQNSSCSSVIIQSAGCKVCKLKCSCVEATVLHIQNDHHTEVPDNLGNQEKESKCQDDLPASKIVATSRVCKTTSKAPVINVIPEATMLSVNTPAQIRCLGDESVKSFDNPDVVAMSDTDKPGVEMTKEEQELLQAVESIQDLQVTVPVQHFSSETALEGVEDVLNRRLDTFTFGYENSLV